MLMSSWYNSCTGARGCPGAAASSDRGLAAAFRPAISKHPQSARAHPRAARRHKLGVFVCEGVRFRPQTGFSTFGPSGSRLMSVRQWYVRAFLKRAKGFSMPFGLGANSSKCQNARPDGKTFGSKGPDPLLWAQTAQHPGTAPRACLQHIVTGTILKHGKKMQFYAESTGAGLMSHLNNIFKKFNEYCLLQGCCFLFFAQAQAFDLQGPFAPNWCH